VRGNYVNAPKKPHVRLISPGIFQLGRDCAGWIEMAPMILRFKIPALVDTDSNRTAPLYHARKV
jgi:hypothetical protein